MGRKQRLELTWFNKGKALIPAEAGKYGYMWVDAADPRYCETRPLIYGKDYEGGGRPHESMEPTTPNALT